MNLTQPFIGKTAVVSGAGRGIGRSTSIGLAIRGAHVVLLARSSDELDEAVRVIRERGGDALAMPTDVGDPVATKITAQRIIDDVGGADILINNAAVVWPLGPSVSVDVSEWARAIAVNLTGAVTLTLALLPGMLERTWGRVINVSSGIAAKPDSMIGGNAYATSKSALEAHTINLAAELADSGVTVNVYRPGTVDTGMQAWIRRQSGNRVVDLLRDRFVDSYEKGKLITPDDSAESLLLNLETDATGQIWNFAL
jgi:3-oxoacyl-[acyl-carrier protein] reductase